MFGGISSMGGGLMDGMKDMAGKAGDMVPGGEKKEGEGEEAKKAE